MPFEHRKTSEHRIKGIIRIKTLFLAIIALLVAGAAGLPEKTQNPTPRRSEAVQ